MNFLNDLKGRIGFGSRTKGVNEEVMRERENGYTAGNSIGEPNTFGNDYGILVSTGNALYAYDPAADEQFEISRSENFHIGLCLYENNLFNLSHNKDNVILLHDFFNGQVFLLKEDCDYCSAISDGDRIYIGEENGVWKYEHDKNQAAMNIFTKISNEAIQNLHVHNGKVLGCGQGGVYYINEKRKMTSGPVLDMTTLNGHLIMSMTHQHGVPDKVTSRIYDWTAIKKLFDLPIHTGNLCAFDNELYFSYRSELYVLSNGGEVLCQRFTGPSDSSERITDLLAVDEKMFERVMETRHR